MVSVPPRESVSQFETLEPHGIAGGGTEPRWPCLTILYHPELRRVGESTFLGQLMGKQPMELSRKTPAFMGTDSAEGQPLRDQYLSRTPVLLYWTPDNHIKIVPPSGVHLDVDEQRVQGSIRIPVARLSEGVILTLSRRVILLLHAVSLRECPPSWGLVGESEGICQVRQRISQVADLDVAVFIRGETGVGKERVAQAIHRASRRATRPCISVNMAAIPSGTAASELFGHVKGAFTGAIQRNHGLFERADGGTLFLDEVGDTPADIQAMLLRALSERKIMPVGDLNERTIDVRIIAATDADIEKLAEQGRFRQALLYRLTSYEILVPSLRERREDIPRLVVHFLCEVLEEIGETWRLMSRSTDKNPWFPPGLMLRLYKYDWPGNVRQLRNVVHQVVISSRRLEALAIDETVQRILSNIEDDRSIDVPSEQPAAGSGPARASGVTDEQVYAALEDCGWKVRTAAEKLGVNRSRVYKAMARHPQLRRARDIPRQELEDCVRECDNDLDCVCQRLRVSRYALKMRLAELYIVVADDSDDSDDSDEGEDPDQS
jgi:two-component system, NtrC family, nitrogen regulation response regulator GlnG